MIDGFFRYAEPLAVIIAALAAIYGIGAWRRETRGKRRMELAEEALAMFYRAGDAIGNIRSPLGFASEGSSRPADPGETPQEKEMRDRAYIHVERCLRYSDLFDSLRAKRYQFMACFGKKAQKPFDDMWMIRNRILVAARQGARARQDMKREGLTPESRQAIIKSIEKCERVVWQEGENDPIDREVEQIIAAMEAICIPVLNPPKWWWHFVRKETP